MKRLVVLSGYFADPEPELRSRLESAAGDLSLVYGPDREFLEERIGSVEAACGGIPEDLVPRAAALRWVQLHGAGAEGGIARYGNRDNLIITNASGIHAIPIAEHFLAMMLSFARVLHVSAEHKARRLWDRSIGERFFEIDGSHAVVVGLGSIGREFSRRATALGMTVSGVNRDGRAVADVTEVVGPDRLKHLLPDADFVVNILPFTHDTERIFGAEEFADMKPTAIFLNAGRGKTVDESALISALQSGQIAGAGLDVFETEPLPENSPLWEMSQVIITPHIAGLTPRYRERLIEIVVENLQRYVRGDELINIVDPDRGY